ncbi:MAG: 4-carboxy-4-hydroxy-2-oxoadipate aldolase/oxaloacetate decarboxylase [Pseudomonadota bacterium]
MNDFGKVVRQPPRASAAEVAALAQYGVSTVHEAMGRVGLARPVLRPNYVGARLCGTAVTVLSQPGDNWMLHAAAEQIREGDVVVMACTTENTDGYFGELLATSYRARGARGLVIDGGCRDVRELTEMQFPVFARAFSAKGTVKGSVGSINVPVVCAGVLVRPGDVVMADDDGVLVVPREHAAAAAEASAKRETKEAATRARLSAGELGLDIYGMRDALAKAGLYYVDP